MSTHRPGEYTRVWRAVALVFLVGIFLLSGSSLAIAATPQINQTAAEVKALSELVNQLNRELGAATEEYNFAKQQFEDTQAAVNETTAELARANDDLAAAQDRLSERLVSIYKSGGLDTLDMLLGVNSFSALVAYLDTLRLIGNQDSLIVDEVEAYKTEKEELKAKLDVQLQEQETYKEQTEAAQQSVQAQLAKNKEALKGKEALLTKLRQEEAERQARYRAWLASRPGKVVSLARQYMGVRYVWGGASPNGFDCSGLVQYVYKQVGVSLPHSSRMQYNYGTAVARSNLRAGDLVFFYTPIQHVGIYIGSGKMIDATGNRVQVSDVFTRHYRGARRVL